MTILIVAVLVFFARILFSTHYLIPWDFREFHLPLAAAVFDAMKGAGSVLWDTSTYCGRPLFADPQAQVFYPPTYVAIRIATLFSAGNLAYVMEWELVLHIIAAGLFAYLLLRKMGLTRASALCGGLVFQLSGFFASQTQHLDVVESAAWMPLLWTGVWQLRNGYSARWFGVTAVAGAMSILAGVPPMATTVLASAAIFALLLWAMRHSRLGSVLSVAAALAVAAGLSAVMLVPATQLTLLSIARYRTDWFDGWGFPPSIFKSLILLPPRSQVCDLLYCGIGGLGLAVTAVLLKSCRRLTVPLLSLTMLSGIWMLGNGTVYGRMVWTIMPKLVKGSLYPYYAIAPLCLGIAALAGVGLDAIPRLAPYQRYAIALLVAADLIVAGFGRPMNTVDVRLDPGTTRDRIDGSAETLRTLRRITQGEPPARTDTHAGPLPLAMAAALIQVPSANGYNPLALERLTQVRLSFAKGSRWGASYEVENLASPVVDALGVRYILTRQPIESPRFALRAELPGFRVYENNSAVPRFFLVHEVRTACNSEQAFKALRQPDFTPSSMAVVEAPSSAPRLAVSHEPPEPVKVVSYGAREIDLQITPATPAYLVTSETNYPGWRAWIDGVEAPVLTTNGAFRGLFVPAGSHRVRFAFQPRILYIGAAISALFACALLGVCLAHLQLRPIRDNT